MDKMINNVNDEIEHDADNYTNETVKKNNIEVGICPRCGSVVKEGPNAFYCTDIENCEFYIYKHDKRISRNYTADEIRELLAEGKVTLRNCISTKGNKYAAVFELDDTGEYVNLKFLEYVKTRKKKSKGE